MKKFIGTKKSLIRLAGVRNRKENLIFSFFKLEFRFTFQELDRKEKKRKKETVRYIVGWKKVIVFL